MLPVFPDSDADSEKRSMRDEQEEGEEAAAEAGSIFGSQDRASLWFACVLSLKLFSSYDRSLVTPVSLVHPLHSLTRSLLKYRCIS
jgi:hypothetical protein